METKTTFTDQLKAIPPGESRMWEMDFRQKISKCQLVSRLNQQGYDLSTKYYGGILEVTNNAKKED